MICSDLCKRQSTHAATMLVLVLLLIAISRPVHDTATYKLLTSNFPACTYHDRLKKIFFILRVPQMQLTPPLLGLTVKAALAADLSHIWSVRMLGYCGAYLSPKMPAVMNSIGTGAVNHSI